MLEILSWRRKYPSISLADLQAIARCALILDKEAACERVASGYPVSYLLQEAPFGPTLLSIEEPLLIPRPQTWDWMSNILPQITPGQRALDLGCGPGTLGVALSFYYPCYFDLLAVDIEEKALLHATKNLSKQSFRSVEVRFSDWFSAIESDRVFDLIVSNPPYCCESERPWMQNTAHESPQALFAAFGGLQCYEHIIQNAKKYLTSNGIVLLEHGASQGAAIIALSTYYGFERWGAIYDTMGAWRATWLQI